MTSIDRTAYPHLNKQLSDKELSNNYELSDEEQNFIHRYARNDRGYLVLAALLKTRQQLGYFTTLREVPIQIVTYLSKQLEVAPSVWQPDESHYRTTLHRYRTVCRKRLESSSFSDDCRKQIISYVRKAAHTMSDPADLINVAVEELVSANIELPAFSSLDRLVGRERKSVHEALYLQITSELKPHDYQKLDELLQVQTGERITGFARMKKTPGPATLKHFRDWSDRLTQLLAVLDPKPFFKNVAYTKIRQFAAEASAYEISDMRGISNDSKRYTLLLSLLHQTQRNTRDELIEMLLKRMKRVEHSAKERLRELKEQHREMEESLIGTLGQVLQHAENCDTNEVLGQQIRDTLNKEGGIEVLADQFKRVTAFHHNNYLPFLWRSHASNRAVIFRVLERLDIKSSTQDRRLLSALTFICEHSKTRKNHLPQEIELCFASQRWQRFVEIKDGTTTMFDRRSLEVCVLIHIAEALDNNDLYVEDSSAYADYRDQLLSWSECKKRLPEYCQSLGLPTSANEFVDGLCQQLTKVSEEVDQGFPGNSELTIDGDGVPHLKRQNASPTPDGLEAFKKETYGRMPEHHLLDILKHVQHWSHYEKRFGPPSGTDTKITDPANRYIYAVFGYGCNLGASQTARHAPENIHRQTLRRINFKHINATKLEAALSDVSGEYSRFELPSFWGKRNVAIADGTHIPLRKNNLMGEQHIRYGGYGGIAYHHISSEYVALFSHFISCGVWEAVYILDALLLNKSTYQPDTLHADTHGQSEPVFALAHLLGIKLFPRMRTWNDVAFYRPDKKMKYKHIDQLFSKTIDWELIKAHWQVMMQVVLSIQAGNVLPSMLLRKLNSRNRRNKLYRAFRELGRVKRTLFLLRYISEADFRQSIRAETTKVESYNDFLDWISFGGQIVKSGDPVEQTKQIKYADLIANSIMLHNVVDLTDILIEMANKGEVVTKELIAGLSPYIRDHIQRFGRYDVNMDDPPPNLEPKSVLVTP